MRHIYKSNSLLANAEEAIETAVVDLGHYGLSVSRANGEYRFDFETSSAAIRIDKDGLLVRVGSDEVVDCHGTKTLIISQISKYAVSMPLCILWIEASDEPFEAILANR